MPEALPILGSRCPGALFASTTPGIDVVRMAMLPILATMVPGAGQLFCTRPVPGSPLAVLLPLALGLEEPLVGGALTAELLVDAALPAEEID
jgi:hypothetical protein